MRLKYVILLTSLHATVLSSLPGCQAHSAEPNAVETAMVKATKFFRDKLSTEGSYVWFYNASDLSDRLGEGITSLSQGWAEPPGTPAVGLAYLAAYKATGRPIFLDSAKETARALIRTQLESGGWQGLLEFDPAARKTWCYRVDKGKGRPGCDKIDNHDLKNASSLDDNQSQSSLTFLIRLDEELDGDIGDLRDAVEYALDQFIKAQYPNGAWPFRLDFKVPDALTNSAWRARYPAEWPRTFKQPLGEVYVVNDHLMRDMIRLFLLAYDVYDEPTYLATAKRGGDFLLAAQMPEPQPGWAQTYNANLEPIWGRRFEPPAIASNETAGAIQALLELYAVTGEQRYIDAAQTAVDWLERSRLPNDEWSRFYELGSNKPLYVDSSYEVTYSDEDLPDHYTLTSPFGIARVLNESQKFPAHEGQPSGKKDVSPVPKAARVTALLDALDDQGRWVFDDKIASGVFVKRITALASYIAEKKEKSIPDYLRSINHQLDRK